MKCRNCEENLIHTFADLGTSPPSNSFLSQTDLNAAEVYYPLKVMVCHKCYLVQLDEFKKSSDIFSSDYIYYSSFSKSWLEHSKKYVEMIISRLKLTRKSFVVEIASNDGYLLQNFVQKEIPCLGVEPTEGTAKVAIAKGVETLIKFFGKETAEGIKAQYQKADLILGNNVIAHVPDLHDFLQGVRVLLNENGVFTFEFPHLSELIKNNQFDTIYHEHFSYISLTSLSDVMKKNGLKIIDVESVSTHGGSLRVFGAHDASSHPIDSRVQALLETETEEGVKNISSYVNFSESVEKIKLEVLSFLIDCKMKNKKVAAYGAAAKGNTLLNFCGIKSDLISFVCDASPYKQDKYLPGSRIPVYGPEKIKEFAPDFVIIFPWNLVEEIKTSISGSMKNESHFVTFIPELRMHSVSLIS
jgi:hypothetical protein